MINPYGQFNHGNPPFVMQKQPSWQLNDPLNMQGFSCKIIELEAKWGDVPLISVTNSFTQEQLQREALRGEFSHHGRLIRGFPQGTPIPGSFIMDNPKKWMIWGYPGYPHDFGKLHKWVFHWKNQRLDQVKTVRCFNPTEIDQDSGKIESSI